MTDFLAPFDIFFWPWAAVAGLVAWWLSTEVRPETFVERIWAVLIVLFWPIAFIAFLVWFSIDEAKARRS